MMGRGVRAGEARQDGVLVTGGVSAPKGRAGLMLYSRGKPSTCE